MIKPESAIVSGFTPPSEHHPSSCAIIYDVTFNDDLETNSYNESLSVDADDQTLFLKSLGLSDLGRSGEPQELSPQGATELLWSLFIAPLQRT